MLCVTEITAYLIIIIIKQNKIDKYSKLASTHIFYPFAIETAGTWHEMAIELTQEKTPGRQHSFSNTIPWLCKEEMQFLTTTPW